MKTIHQLLLPILLLTSVVGTGSVQGPSETSLVRLEVQATPDLLEISRQWAGNFNSSSKNYVVEVNPQFTPDQITALALVNETEAQSLSSDYWRMVVGRQIVVPIRSTVDKAHLKATGITLQNLRLLAEQGNVLRSNASIVKNTTQSWEIPNSKTLSLHKLLQQLNQQPEKIGLFSLSEITDSKTGNIIEGLAIVPIDRNGNGSIDFSENFYDDLNQFKRSVWMGKYPHELYQNIYAFANDKPSEEALLEFIRYMVTDGQILLAQTGSTPLVAAELPTKMAKLLPDMAAPSQAASSSSMSRFIIMIVLAGVLLVLVTLMLLTIRAQKIHQQPGNVILESGFDEKTTMEIPEGMYFDQSFTWAFRERNGLVRVGVDNFLTRITGPISRILLKEENSQVSKGEDLLTLIKEGKKLTIKSPVSGVIRNYNSHLKSDSKLITRSPYDAGWVYLIEPLNWQKELSFLKNAALYREWVKTELARLKDYLANLMNSTETRPVLQDGGELANGILSDLPPRIWEDFQNEFLDQ